MWPMRASSLQPLRNWWRWTLSRPGCGPLDGRPSCIACAYGSSSLAGLQRCPGSQVMGAVDGLSGNDRDGPAAGHLIGHTAGTSLVPSLGEHPVLRMFLG